MSPDATRILRLVLAGMNGLLFAFGTWYLTEQAFLKVRRWKRLLLQLENALFRNPDHPSASRIREEAADLQQKIQQHQHDPRLPLRLGFGVLVITLSVVALIGLFAPPWMMLVR